MKIKDMVIFKGKKYKFIHTRDITLDDLRAVFFPKDFYEKYNYLGSVPYSKAGEIFQAMEPLVIYMDYKAKPKYCPRWVLRFLHLFGSDNSIVRVRNRTLHNLGRRLTKGFLIVDYKTKWTDYDLRISIYGDERMNNLSESIENDFYNRGYRVDLAEQIKELDPNTKFHSGYNTSSLKTELDRLENEKS